MMNMELLHLAFWPLTATPHQAVTQGMEFWMVFCLIIIVRLYHSSLGSLGSLIPVAQRRAEEALNTVKEAGAAVMSLFPLVTARNRNSQRRRQTEVEYEDWMPITSPYKIPHES